MLKYLTAVLEELNDKILPALKKTSWFHDQGIFLNTINPKQARLLQIVISV